MGLCEDNDGPMALFSLICHYRVSSNDNEETLRYRYRGAIIEALGLPLFLGAFFQFPLTVGFLQDFLF